MVSVYVYIYIYTEAKEGDIEEGKLFTRTKNEYCAGNVSSGSWILGCIEVIYASLPRFE